MKSAQMSSASEVSAEETVRAQVVVVGLGAGGSMAFHDLALAGVDVLALELGDHMPTEQMTRREEQMLPRLFMEGASRATEDLAIRILQGRGVGGSTLHNTNLCKRLSEPLREEWASRFGLDFMVSAQLTRDFEAVEQLLGVHPVPDDRVNANNQVFARGVQRLGWRGGRLSHNRDGCKQSGFCELGCPNNGKQNAAKVLIPAGLEAGGRILTQARAERLEHKGHHIKRVRVVHVDGQSGEDRHGFWVEAEHYVLAASATNSAALVLRSKLPDPHHLAGTNLHLHPGAFTVGVFDEPVYSWRGVPQSEECSEFLSETGGARGRVWIVSGAAHPGSAASLLPGFGPEHGRMMRMYPNVAVAISMLHDHSKGRVLPGEGEHVSIHYRLEREDWEQVLLGLKQSARIYLAAGAKQVVLPLSPTRFIRRESELDALTLDDVGPFRPGLVAVHPMSTLWMGKDARTSVVDARGVHHHVSNLSVADGSLFPTSIGGPPQIPIYTFGRHVARHVREALRAPMI